MNNFLLLTNEDSSILQGFTLIELLVVIAIISLLSSVVLASLSNARRRAKITRTVSDLKQIEKGIMLWMDASGRVQFPKGGGNPTLENFASNYNLGEYLTIPDSQFGDGSYYYDYDGDKFLCGDTAYKGVNIFIQGISDANIRNEINEIIDDDGDLGCGKVRASSNDNLLYSISNDGSL